MNWIRQRLARSDQGGFGLILVIGFVLVITMILVIVGTLATRSLASSRDHNHFESAVTAAEAGVDTALARTQYIYDKTGVDNYVSPAPASRNQPYLPSGDDCTGTVVAWPFGSQPTVSQETNWADTELQSLTSTCLHTTSQGDYVFFKPSGRQSIYAMGWAPHYGALHAKVRVLKVDYLFSPYAPSNAVLTGGNLQIDSSTTVTTAPGSAANLADIHSNGGITVANGNPTVTGQVSASGTSSGSSNNFPGGQIYSSAPQPIPSINALEVWGRETQNSAYAQEWYDLCSDGTARSVYTDGTDTTQVTAPCTGNVLWNASAPATTDFRGWSYTAGSSGQDPVWTDNADAQSGIFYVDGADVQSGNGNPTLSNFTLIAQASNTSCPKTAGSINWNHYNITSPAIQYLWMLADQDIATGSNFSAGSLSPTVVSGMFVAGDQIDLQTSSSGAVGSIVAGDQCTPSPANSAVGNIVTLDEIKNPSLYYDPNASAPFVSVVDTTQWLELVP